MKKLLLLFPLLFIAAKPGGGGSGWRKADTNLSRWTFANISTPQSGDIATVPIQSSSGNYTAFVVTNTTGNIAGKTITATFTVTATSGDPGYVWGGYNFPPPYDYGTMAEARFYFSTHTDYSTRGYNDDPSGYWFARTSVLIDDVLGTVTLSCPVQPDNWSQSFGHIGSEPAYTAAFMSAAQNKVTVGLALASEHFYDIGIGTTNGTAILHLNSFQVQ